jgi:hypothetical protein
MDKKVKIGRFLAMTAGSFKRTWKWVPDLDGYHAGRL